jgi:ferredoxin
MRLGMILCGGDDALVADVFRRCGFSVPAVVRADLCKRPQAAAAFAESHGLQRLVVGACSGMDADKLSSALRAKGIDGWNSALVRLDWWEAPGSEPAALLAAALARFRVAPEVGGQHLAFRFRRAPQRLSRRRLLALSRPAAVLVPAPHGRRCVALYGCRQCADVCSRGAIVVSDDGVRIDRQRCDGCGLCVAGCPAGALSLPGAAAPEMAAALRALLAEGRDSGVGPVVAFACPPAFRRLQTAPASERTLPASTLPCEVPSLGVAVPTLAVLALALGARRVLLLGCADDCRSHGGREALHRQLPALRSALRSLGHDDGVIDLTEADALGRVDLREADRGQAASAAGWPPYTGVVSLGFALALLARRRGAPSDAEVAVAGLPAGLVSVNPERCSLCGLCAVRCPTGALRLNAREGEARLEMTAAACAGCGLCVSACPEHAISVRRQFPVAELLEPRRELMASGMDVCVRCGAAIAPTALRLAVARRLGRPDMAPACGACSLTAPTAAAP